MNLIESKFETKCAGCGNRIQQGEKAWYNPKADPGKKMKHEACVSRRLWENREVKNGTLIKKRCSRCKQMKSARKYWTNASRPDGYQDWCKDCHKEWWSLRVGKFKNEPVKDEALADLEVPVAAQNGPSEAPANSAGTETPAGFLEALNPNIFLAYAAQVLGISVEAVKKMTMEDVAAYVEMAQMVEDLRKANNGGAS